MPHPSPLRPIQRCIEAGAVGDWCLADAASVTATGDIGELGVAIWLFDSVGVKDCVEFARGFSVPKLVSERWVLFQGLN